MFDPKLVDKLFQAKQDKEKVKEESKIKSYRNTEVSGATKEDPIKRATKRERMKLEVEQKKEEYDFKYIKRKFDYTADKDNVYLEPSKLDKLIRAPHI
jgi:hypothetical protein